MFKFPRLTTLLAAAYAAYLTTLPAHATNYYVDPALPTSGNGLSWGTAWNQFAFINWSAINAGDTIYLSGGATSQLYAGTFLTPLNVQKAGVTISVGHDTGHSGIAILSGQYVNLPGFNNVHLTGDNGTGVTNLWLTDFYDTSNRTFANKVVADGTTGFVMDHVMASNVNQCVSLVGAQGFDVRNNYLEARGDAAVRAVNSPDNGFNSHRVRQNTIVCDYATNQPGYLGPDGIQGSHGLTVQSNYFTIRQVNYATSTQHPDFTQLIGNHLTIRDNTFVNVGDSCNDFDWWANPNPHDILIYNNVYQITTAIDPFPEYIRFYVSAGNSIATLSNFQVVNNTFANNTTWASILGSWGASGNPAVTNFRIANNIFYNATFSINNNPQITGTTYGSLSNNIYTPGLGVINKWLGTNYEANAITTLVDTTGQCAFPTFVGGTNFHYASAASVGVGLGLNYSSVFTTDADGVTRGATWDDGAYQWVNGGDTSVPATPSNVAPANLATNVSLQPTLTLSAYSATGGNTQTAVQFQVLAADGTTVVQDSGARSDLTTSWVLPAPLAYATTYKWKGRYDNINGPSSYSTPTTFTTGNASTQTLTIRVMVLKSGKVVVLP